MSFQLSDTPTLQAVANEDEQLLAEDLQARVAEAVSQAEAEPDVAAAIEAQQQSAARLEQLRSAERGLNEYASTSRARADNLSGAALDSMVETAAAGGKIDTKPFAELGRIDNLIRYTGRAIQRLAEHMIPLAQIAGLREESHALMATARALERIAQERAEKVLGQIREAVSEEMVLPVDMSQGVAGALLAQARTLRGRSIQLSENADQLERAYQDRNAV